MARVPEDCGVNLRIAADNKTDLGEGPFWDDRAQRLVFVDCNRGQILRLDPSSRETTAIGVDRTIGVAIPRLAGGFVVSSSEGLLSVPSQGGDPSLLVPIEFDLPDNRMNDGKCDSRGRLWSGTFSVHFDRGAGSLYRIGTDLSLTRMVEGVRVSNGIAWSPDDRLMYFNDTLSRGIDVFDYDIETGNVSNRRRFAEIAREEGLPDGMAVDSEGCVWVALYHGGQVRRYAPDGSWIGVVTLPVARVTSCNFGGKDLDRLFITTADMRIIDDGNLHEPEAGYIFSCEPGVKGLPSYPFGG